MTSVARAVNSSHTHKGVTLVLLGALEGRVPETEARGPVGIGLERSPSMGNSVYRSPKEREDIYFLGTAKSSIQFELYTVYSLSWGVNGDEGEKVGCNQVRKGFINHVKQLGFTVSGGGAATLENRKTVWQFLKKLNINLPYDPAVPLMSSQEKQKHTSIQRPACECS